MKSNGLPHLQDKIVSADSLAWSYNARRNPPLPGHTHAHCNNCWGWAQRWRSNLLEKLK